MGEETILESIFFDREQRVLANVSDEEKNVILEIKRDGNEDKLRKLINFKFDRNTRYKLSNKRLKQLEKLIQERVILLLE